MDESAFEPGQVWLTSAADGLPPLMCIIGRVEPGARETIVSVSVLAHPQAREAGWPNVMHMAFCATALADSGMRLFDDAAGSPVSGFEEGYASWREKHLAGEAGVFTLPLGAAYAAVTSVANGPSRG